MRTRSLETLRREAATACKWRGHSMRWQAPFEYHSGRISDDVYVTGLAQDGVCRVCGMDVRVMTRPDPNECEISGNALALTCEPPDGVVVRYGKNTLRKTEHGYMAENEDGLTDWPILQVEPSAPGFERHALWDHPSWFPLKFRQMVSKYLLKHEKESK